MNISQDGQGYVTTLINLGDIPFIFWVLFGCALLTWGISQIKDDK